MSGPGGAAAAWPAWQRVAFRFAFIFLLQLTLPFELVWGTGLSGDRFLKHLFEMPRSFGADYVTIQSESGRWGLASFATMGIAALVAIVGAAVWTWLARNSPRTEYRALNYWLRLYVRFWVALNILHYGYVKLYPIQMPFPSISNLHTLFGEHAPYRLYWQHVGLVTWYQMFVGLAEVVAGSLLFFRATTALGAVLNLGILYNVAHANFAYDGGVHVRSVEIALFSAFLLLQYVPDLWRLLIRRENVAPAPYRPSFGQPWQRQAFAAAKVIAWTLFIPGYAYDTYNAFFHSNISKEPRVAGLADATGYYDVAEFRLNGEAMPYSPLDPVRWHDAVIEDYRTLVYKTHRALPIETENGGTTYWDLDKRYELAGFAGGKTYLHYDVDDARQELRLQNKSRLPDAEGAARSGSGSGGRRNRAVPLTWRYELDGPRVTLSGLDERGDEFHARLVRREEQHPILIDSPIEGERPRYGRRFYRRYPATDRSFDGKGSGRSGPRAE